MHGLAFLCHETEPDGNNGRRCSKHARPVFLRDLDSKDVELVDRLMKEQKGRTMEALKK
jgi:hypothetical protein